jgi:hypothetical protein
LDFHPDRLLPQDAGKLARYAFWTAKYLITIVLAHIFIAGILIVLFEPPIAWKALAALASIAAAVIGRWLWRRKRTIATFHPSPGLEPGSMGIASADG